MGPVWRWGELRLSSDQRTGAEGHGSRPVLVPDGPVRQRDGNPDRQPTHPGGDVGRALHAVPVPWSQLDASPVPAGSHYLLAVTDPNNNLGNFDPKQNVQYLVLGQLTPTIQWDTDIVGVDYGYQMS